MLLWYFVVFASLFAPFNCSCPRQRGPQLKSLVEKNPHTCDAECRNLIRNSIALGIEGGLIPDTAFQASSQLDDHHRPQLARLNNVKHEMDKGGWSAKTNDGQQWIKVDLGAKTIVTELLTQGRQDAKEWVTLFTVGFGDDGKNYKMYRDRLSFAKDFHANHDNNGIVKNTFNPPIRARFIRIFPCKWHGHISMRLEFRGMPESKPNSKRCPRTFEIGFLIAGSRRVGQVNFALQKSFVQSVCNMFELSKEGSHVGLVTYSSKAVAEIRLSSFLSNSAVKQKILQIPFPNEEGERIDVGLKVAHELLNEKGVEHTRRTLIMVVSGLINKNRAMTMINKITMMAEEEIKIYVVVIGTSVAGLKALLGYNYGGARMFYLPSFKSLLTYQGGIAHQICYVKDDTSGGEDHKSRLQI